MGDPVCALSFLGHYLRMLPRRMARMVSHLRDQDSKAAMDAVLNLRVSSALAGAQEAGTLCRNHNHLAAAGVAAR